MSTQNLDPPGVDRVDTALIPPGGDRVRVPAPQALPDAREGDGRSGKKKEKEEHVSRPVDSQFVVDTRGMRQAEEGHPAFPKPPKKNRHWVRRIVIGLVILGAIAAFVVWGVPAIRWLLITTSTDDAFVTGHTTNVSPRIEGYVTEVMVERNDRVRAGDLLVRLDREPYAIALNQSEASLSQARANLDQAKAQVMAQLAGARGNFFRRKNAQEQLRRAIKSVEAQVATLRANQSSQKLAAINQRRIENLVKKGSASQGELDNQNNQLDLANQQVNEAWTLIQETRASLGLGPDFDNPLNIPADLPEKQSQVESAVSDIASSLAQVGIPFDAHDIQPGEAFEQLIHMDTSEGIDKAFGRIVERAPAYKVAQASVTRSEADLANAKLQLSYCEIRSEVDGVVQDRTASPGNRVEPGQTMISVRPDYVWVDANYKETQIHHIRIGMPVDLHVDAYPGRVFKGRVAGFSPGTGLSQTLLPPENATGNYVKVTQRLPVRIELIEPNPQDTPLFIGLSVVPYVKIKERPTGPNAGERLHGPSYRQHPDVGGGPSGGRSENRVEFGPRDRP